MVNIFVLKLQDNKYYIGSCNDVNNDVQRYFNGRFGPKWIKKYKPIRIIEVISPCDIFDIDKHTKRYMGIYGVDNVRGGAYTKIKLSKSDRNHIDKEIFTALGMCIHCGSEIHIASNCFHTSFKWQVKSFLTIIKNITISSFNTLKNNMKHCYNRNQIKTNENQNLLQNIRMENRRIEDNDISQSLSGSFSLSSISLSPEPVRVIYNKPQTIKYSKAFQYSDEDIDDTQISFSLSPPHLNPSPLMSLITSPPFSPPQSTNYLLQIK